MNTVNKDFFFVEVGFTDQTSKALEIKKAVKINNAEDLDAVMPMYNLLECSKNQKKKQHVACGIIIEMNQVVVQMMII